MAKLEEKMEVRRESRGTGKRRYTLRDMAIIKKDAANLNGKEKRGEVKLSGTRYIACCGCGVEGCFIHGSVKP